jgi:hypothetical protein
VFADFGAIVRVGFINFRKLPSIGFGRRAKNLRKYEKIMNYFIKAAIDRIEGNFAVLKTEDRQEILWSKNNLPEGAKEGSSVRLTISTSQSDEEERTKLAKTLLNEILQGKKNE